jgi:hypothetical protein
MIPYFWMVKVKKNIWFINLDEFSLSDRNACTRKKLYLVMMNNALVLSFVLGALWLM